MIAPRWRSLSDPSSSGKFNNIDLTKLQPYWNPLTKLSTSSQLLETRHRGIINKVGNSYITHPTPTYSYKEICYISSCISCIGVCLHIKSESAVCNNGVSYGNELVITENTTDLSACLSVFLLFTWMMHQGNMRLCHWSTQYTALYYSLYYDVFFRVRWPHGEVNDLEASGVKYNFYFGCRNISCNFLLANIQPCMTFIDWEPVKCSVQRWPNLFNCLAFMVCELDVRILWC